MFLLCWLLFRLLVQCVDLGTDIWFIIDKLDPEDDAGWFTVLICSTSISGMLLYVRFCSKMSERMIIDQLHWNNKATTATQRISFELPEAVIQNMPMLMVVYNGNYNDRELLDYLHVISSCVSSAMVAFTALGMFVGAIRYYCEPDENDRASTFMLFMFILGSCIYFPVIGYYTFVDSPGRSDIEITNYVMLGLGLLPSLIVLVTESAGLCGPKNAFSLGRAPGSGPADEALEDDHTVSRRPLELDVYAHEYR
jgi:hypothetical protein